MDERTVAWIMMAVGTALVLGLVVMLTTLRDHGLSKTTVRPPKSEGRCSALTTAQRLGVAIMSAVTAALARFTTFVTGVLDQVKSVRETNDAQTAKLAELQSALDAALADDASDKAAIANLQAEVANLQQEVADQINAAVDALENPPIAEPVEDEEEVEEEVEEEPVLVEETTEVVVADDAELVLVEDEVGDGVEVVDLDVVEETVTE